MVGQFDDDPPVGVLDAAKNGCFTIGSFHRGGHYCFALFDVHRGVLTTGAANEQCALSRVDAVFDHVSDVGLQGVKIERVVLVEGSSDRDHGSAQPFSDVFNFHLFVLFGGSKSRCEFTVHHCCWRSHSSRSMP